MQCERENGKNVRYESVRMCACAKKAEQEKKKQEKAAKAPKRKKVSFKRPKFDSEDETDDEDEPICCVCFSALPAMEPNRKCTRCKGYAHLDCSGEDLIFVCELCSSEIDGPFDETSEEDEL